MTRNEFERLKIFLKRFPAKEMESSHVYFVMFPKVGDDYWSRHPQPDKYDQIIVDGEELVFPETRLKKKNQVRIHRRDIQTVYLGVKPYEYNAVYF